MGKEATLRASQKEGSHDLSLETRKMIGLKGRLEWISQMNWNPKGLVLKEGVSALERREKIKYTVFGSGYLNFKIAKWEFDLILCLTQAMSWNLLQ